MSNNLGITDVSPTQNSKTVTINDQKGSLDAAITDVVTYAVTSTNARTLTNAELRLAQTIVVDEDGGDPATADITLTLPAIRRGTFVVRNDTAFNVTVTISGQSETAPVIATASRTLLHSDGVDITAAGGGGGAVAVQEESVEVIAAASAFNFLGEGVTAVDGGGGVADITIPGGPPAAAVGNAGVIEFVETRSFSASTSEDFIDLNLVEGEDIIVEVTNIKVSTANAQLYITVSDDNGSTFKATSYGYGSRSTAGSGSGSSEGGDGTTVISMSDVSSNFGFGNAANDAGARQIIIANPLSTAGYKVITFSGGHNSPSQFISVSGAGSWRGGTGALNAFRLLISTGTFDADVNVYKRRPITPSQVVKAPVRAATTANGVLATAFENGDTIDGVVLATNDVILLKDQSTGAENGHYIVQATGAPVRSPDYAVVTDIVGGTISVVQEGTANADKLFILTNDGAITIGTTALTYSEISGSGGGGGGITANTGTYELIETRVFSGSTTEDFIDLVPLAGESIEIRVTGATLSVDDEDLFLRVSDDNGSTFEATNYRHTTDAINSSGTTDTSFAESGSVISLGGSAANFGRGNGASENGSSIITIHEPAAAGWKTVTHEGGYQSPNSFINVHGGGQWQGGTGTINAFRLFPLTGTFSGTVSVYRIKPLGTQNALVKGIMSGLLMSNGTDADHDIDITTGNIVSDNTNRVLTLGSAFVKQIDAAWAAGTAAGGLFTGTVAADTWYHVFLIEKDSDGSIDAGFDTSITAANIPAGYTAFGRIGSVLTNATSNILGFTNLPNRVFIWDIPIYDTGALGDAPSVETLTSIPPGVHCRVDTIVYAIRNGGGSRSILALYPGVANVAPSSVVQTSTPPTNAYGHAYGSGGTVSTAQRQATVYSTTSQTVAFGVTDTNTFAGVQTQSYQELGQPF